MVSTPNPGNSGNPGLIALCLKVIGLITIVSTLIGYALLSQGIDFSNVDARASLIGQIVDRGIVPLIGIALVMFGTWLEAATSEPQQRSPLPILLSLLLCGFLGMGFTGLGLLYFQDGGQVSAREVSQLNEQAKQAEEQLDARLKQERTQITQLIQNDQQLRQLRQQVSGGNLAPEQRERAEQVLKSLESFKKDPKALDEQQKQARDRALSEIRGRREMARQNLAGEIRKTRLRILFNSLLLGVGFLAILWNGFMGGRSRRDA